MDLDLHRAERRATRTVERVATVATILALITYRRAILGAYWVAEHAPRRTR